jgi:hypothetical protein
MHVYDCVTSRDATPLPVAGEDTTYAPHGEGWGRRKRRGRANRVSHDHRGVAARTDPVTARLF